MGILKMVVPSATESKFGSLFINTKEASILQTTLTELHHPQQPTPVLVDNSMAVGLANDMIIDMLLTCSSTGFGIMLINASLISNGRRRESISQITSPSITLWLTIRKCIHFSYTFPIMLIAFSSSPPRKVLCGGAFILWVTWRYIEPPHPVQTQFKM